MIRSTTTLALVISTTALLVACGNSRRPSPSASSTTPPSTTMPAATAELRVLHASPDAPPVDVVVDGQTALANVPFGAASGYLAPDAGVHKIEVRANGTTTTVLSISAVLAPGAAYTAIALDRLAKVRALLLQDDLTPPASGNARIRIVHASVKAGTVDVYLDPAGSPLGAPAVAGVSFAQASGFLEVPAGDYQARVAASKTVVYDSGKITLASGAILTIVALDAPAGPSPVSLAALTGDARAPLIALPNATAKIRGVHASPDAPAVDVLFDSTLLVQNARFGDASKYVDVLADAHRIRVAPTGTTNAVIDATVSLDTGSATTVIAVDKLAKIAPLVLKDDLSGPARGNVRIRLVHASPSAGKVDIYITAPGADLANAKPTIAGFAFKDASAYLEVPEGAYQVRIALAGTKTVAIDSGTLALTAGQVRTAIAIDPAPGSTKFGAILLADVN